MNRMHVIVAIIGVMIFGVLGTPPNDVCSECDQIVGTIHSFLSNNETEGQVLVAMNEVCKLLPQEFQNFCTEAVSNYGRELIDAAVKYIADPSLLCTLVGMCDGIYNRVKSFEMLKQVGSFYGSQGVNIVPHDVKDLSSCGLCEFVMSLIQQMFQDKPMQDFARDEFNNLCNFLPQSDIANCKSLVQQFEPDYYMNFMKKYLNPMLFCSDVKICPPL